MSTDDRERLKTLERENKELRRANEIHEDGVGFFRTSGARPQTEVMVSYIDEHRDRFGVEPICKVLPIAPSTYYTHRSLQQDPERRSARDEARWMI